MELTLKGEANERHFHGLKTKQLLNEKKSFGPTTHEAEGGRRRTGAEGPSKER